MPFLIVFLVFILGLVIGSFLNVVIWRLETDESFVTGRSHCPKCRKDLGALDLIPILSYLFLRGKCRYCRKKISWEYPLVELITGLLFCFVWIRHGGFINSAEFSIFLPAMLTQALQAGNFQFSNILLLIRDWVLVSSMIVIFVFDFKHYLISDKVIYFTAASLIIFDLALFFLGQLAIADLVSFLLAGVFGILFFLIQFVVSHGRWIGEGDIRLGFLMGLALGWPGILWALFLAYFLGAIVGGILMIIDWKKIKSAIPFGPFLVIGTLVILFYGETLINWYWQSLSRFFS